MDHILRECIGVALDRANDIGADDVAEVLRWLRDPSDTPGAHRGWAKLATEYKALAEARGELIHRAKQLAVTLRPDANVARLHSALFDDPPVVRREDE